jgi:DNA recombination protein RmuC
MDELSLMRLLVVGLVFGVITLWLLGRQRIAQGQAEAMQLRERLLAAEQALDVARSAHTALDQQTGDELRRLSALEGRLSAELGAERQSAAVQRDELSDARSALATAERRVGQLTDELTELRTRTDTEREHADQKLRLLIDAKESLTDQFKSLAADILEEKSKRFAEQNQASLGQLLEPLRMRLGEFQGKVEEVYVQEGKDRSALAAQVRQLMDLNQTLSQDAKNLTQALKGSAKTQGNWGELILERVLEASGLCKGREYHVQDSRVREDGTRAQPDVVIDLPEERSLVVDAKVSLVAYERYVHADTDALRATALRQHVDSVRAHIRSLSEKRYHDLYGKSLDFVLAFVPIEPAFMMAVTHDADLCMEAWRRNVLLVSPSTLLFVVRTVAHLWRQEAQSRNAQDIAKRGAELYDKLSGFVDDLQAVGARLGQAQKAYDAAHSKLATGKGNVIRQAELLREMGVKPTKSLPAPLIEAAEAGDDAMALVAQPFVVAQAQAEARKAA